MEDQRPPAEDVKDQESGLHREPSFFSQLIERLRQSSDDEETDSEEDETEKPKPSKRLERFFGKLFRQTVVAPKTSEKLPADTDHLPTAGLIEQQFTPSLDSDEVPEPKPELNSPADVRELDEALGEEPIGNPDRKIHTEPVVQESEVIEAAHRELHPSSQESNAPDLNNKTLEFSQVMPEPALVYERSAAPVEFTNAESSQATNSSEVAPISKSKVDRRGTALVTALLGAEFWARRRADREIRRDLKKVRHEHKRTLDKTTGIEAALASQDKSANKKMPLTGPSAMPEPASFNNILKKPEKTKEAPMPIIPNNETVNREVSKPLIVTAEKLAQVPSLPEQKPIVEIPTIEAQSVNISERQQGIGIKEEKNIPEPSSEKVLRVVAEAAEKNVPLEKDYERRHEVKDASTQIATGVASVGAILTGMGIESSGTTLPQKPLNSRAEPKTSEQKYSLPKAQSADMYQQAIKMGFWSAVAIILFIIIIGLYRN